jgi:DNA-binding CsgD family transcriptional regulator
MIKSIYVKIVFLVSALTLIPCTHPCTQETESAPPRIEITKVKLLGINPEIRSDSEVREVIEYPEVLKITWKDSFFIIEFNVLGSREPELNQYTYKIIGHNEEWIHLGSKNFVVIESPKAGKYDFRVKGANSEGIWSGESASLKIIIIPPFWKTPAFIGVGILLTAILFIFVSLLFRKLYKSSISADVDVGQISTKYKLTDRENEVLKLLLKGKSIQSLAHELYISESTVQKHIYSVYKKLKISNRMQLLNLTRRFKKK